MNEKAQKYMEIWRQDWNRFCYDVLKARLDKEQQAIVDSVQHNPMTAVASGTARGKDFVSACACLCFFYLTPRFDKFGNMNDWWSAEDRAAFEKKTEVLIKQFNAIEILPGLFADGKYSLGENIADQGGLRLAFTGLKEYAWAEGRPEDIDGFTGEQRFYIGYATLWAQNITDQEKERLTKVDVHSLGRNRVNATLRNIQSFYDAFGITEKDAMYMPVEERIVIW